MTDQVEWIEALGESSIMYAAREWGVAPVVAYARIQIAVSSEALSERLPEDEFKEYVQICKTKTRPGGRV